MDCPHCNGRGYNSDVTTIGKETCDTCRGTGTVYSCSKCDGSGEVLQVNTVFKETCPDCSGNGWHA